MLIKGFINVECSIVGMDEEQKLITLYHKALENNDDKAIITTSLHLAQYYYEQENIHKAKHHLLTIVKKDPTIENLNLYLALVEIYFDNIENAKKYLKKELKYHPHNTYAKNLLEKITISVNFPYATLLFSLLFICVFVFFYPEMSFSQTLLFGLSAQNFSIFSAITSLFSHLNIFHLVLNTLIFLSIGSLVERHIGSLEFSLFFLFAGIVSNISQILLTTTNSIVLGASGAIFGVMGILLMQQPLLQLRLFGIIKVPVILLYGSLFSLSLLFSNYLFGSAEISHTIGLFIGILYAGIRYQETITVFYHWILITFGFYFIIGLPQQLFIFQNYDIYSLFISSVYLLIGIGLIAFSYIRLKKTLNFSSITGDRE